VRLWPCEFEETEAAVEGRAARDGLLRCCCKRCEVRAGRRAAALEAGGIVSALLGATAPVQADAVVARLALALAVEATWFFLTTA